MNASLALFEKVCSFPTGFFYGEWGVVRKKFIEIPRQRQHALVTLHPKFLTTVALPELSGGEHPSHCLLVQPSRQLTDAVERDDGNQESKTGE